MACPVALDHAIWALCHHQCPMSIGHRHLGTVPLLGCRALTGGRLLRAETLVRALAHPLLWAGFQVIFYFSMVLMTISCIVVTASSLDTLSLLLLDNAWGLQLSPRLAWVASCPGAGGADALFGTPSAGDVACASQAEFDATAAAGGHIISAGYMLTVALTLPFALIEISEAFQATAYCVSLACLLQLIAKFTAIALFPALAGGGPADGASLAAMAAASPPAPLLRPIGRDLGVVAEVSFWSWCISFAVPMWLDEKAEALPISRPLWLSFTHRAVLDLLLGLSGAAAFPRMSPERLNVLDAVAVHPACGALTKACGVLFVISSLAPNIVDYSMVAARNLECHLGTGAANGLGIAVPFAVAFLFYFGTSFSTLVNVASPLLNGLVQFVVPALLFAAYERLDSSGGSVTPPSASPSASTHGSSAWNHAFSAAAAEAGRATLAPGAGRYVRVLGLNLPVDTWRRAAIALAAAIVALIAATYVLNETVGSAIIRADSAHGNADYSS